MSAQEPKPALSPEQIRELLLDMKRYIVYHDVLMGECVAWNKLKQAFGVDEAFYCPCGSGLRAWTPGVRCCDQCQPSPAKGM